MSKIIKFAVVLAFVLSVISVVTSLMIAVRQVKYKDLLKSKSTENQQTEKMRKSINEKIRILQNTTEENKKLKTKMDKIENNLQTASEKIENLQNQLKVKDDEITALNEKSQLSGNAASEGQVADLTVQLDELKKQLIDAESKISLNDGKHTDLNDKLADLSVSLKEKDKELIDARKRESDLLTLVSMLKSQVSQLKAITDKKQDTTEKIEATIEVLNEELMFIVFDMGSKNGIKQDDVLKVFRNDEFLGLVTVIEVFPNKAAASITHKLLEKQIAKDCIIRK